jgi:hypothetical protein
LNSSSGSISGLKSPLVARTRTAERLISLVMSVVKMV